MLRARLNRQLTKHQLESFFHADQAESSPPLEDVIQLKADSRIAHAQRNVTAAALQRHLDTWRAAVFDRILQRLLQNAIQAERNLLRQMSDVTDGLKVDRDVAPLGYLTTKAAG